MAAGLPFQNSVGSMLGMHDVVSKPDRVIQAVLDYRAEDNLDAAERVLSDSLKVHPDAFWHLLEMGILLNERNRSHEALPFLARASRWVPEDGRGALALALAYKAAGRVARFKELLATALNVQDPTCRMLATLEQGRAAATEGRYSEGADCMIRALELEASQPVDFWYLIELCGLLTKSGRTAEALTHLDRAGRLVPQEGRGAVALAEAYRAAGCEERFYEVLQAASVSDDAVCRALACVELGTDAIVRGEREEGADYLIDALEADPETAETPGRLEFIELPPAAVQRCRERLMQTVERGEGSKNVYLSLAWLALLAGSTDESTSWLRRATESISVKGPRLARNGRALTPSFIIIGAMKSGTTALYKYLLQHPRIVPGVAKEIRYFDRDQVDINWYRAHFPTGFSPALYRSGEASPIYFELDVQERIRAEFPEMKLIAIMRDPVRRAISHYHHNVKRFRTADPISSKLLLNIESFEALRGLSRDEATDRLLDFYRHIVNRLLGVGFYELILHRWLRYFPREQLFLTSLERLSAEPESVMDELFHFLHLPAIRGQSYGVELAGNYRKDVRYDFEPRLEALYAPTVACLREEYGIEF